MATVPGVLLLTGYHGQGGASSFFPGYPQQQLGAINDPRLERHVPSLDPLGEQEQPLPDFYPWYDSSASPTIHTVASSGASTITVSPSPGWAVNQWANRKVTILELLFGVPTLPLMPRETGNVASNTADTITVASPWAQSPAGLWFRLGAGRFIAYNASAGVAGFSGVETFETSPGLPSPVTQGLGSAFDTGGSGLGPDSGLLPALYRTVWPIDPWFHVYKHARVHGVVTGYGDGGGGRAEFESELARVVAAAAARGNVIDWRLCIIDVSEFDMRTASTSESLYVARFQQMMAWVRATLAKPALHFQVVNHDQQAHSILYPGVARRWRAMHRSLARTEPRLAIVDMAGEVMSRYQQSGEPSSDFQFYARPRYHDQGQRFASTYLRQLSASAPPVTAGVGLPVYVMLGDDFAVGQIPEEWTVLTSSQNLLGLSPTFVRKEGDRIWNKAAGAMQPYDPTSNANTSGTVVDASGPDLSAFDELARLHPDGFLVVKHAAISSALATQVSAFVSGASAGGRWLAALDEHLDAMLVEFRRAQQFAADLGFVPDSRGLMIMLGHHDATVAGGGAAFAAALPDFIAELRERIASRTSGKALPIAWRRPALAAAGMRPAERDAVRAALAARQAADTALRVVDCDDLERSRTDNWRDTPESAVAAGRRMVQAVAAIAL